MNCSHRDSRGIVHPCPITEYTRILNGLAITPYEHKDTLPSSIFPPSLFRLYRLCVLGFKHPLTDPTCVCKRSLEFKRYEIVLVHLQDMVIFSEIHEDHIRHIWMVLTSLNDGNGSLNHKKCHFFVEIVN